MKKEFPSRLIYGVLTAVVCWYAYLTPIALGGEYRNKLIPSLSMFPELFHVWLIVGIWTLTASRRAVLIATPILAALYFGIALHFGADPGHEFLTRNGWGAYLWSWGMLLLPAFFAPTLAALLLLNADRIAPKLVKKWRPVYE